MLITIIPKFHTKRHDRAMSALSACFEELDFDSGFLLN
jgi:hypothetical protein